MTEQKQVRTEEIKAYLKAYCECMRAHAAEMMDQPMPVAERNCLPFMRRQGTG